MDKLETVILASIVAIVSSVVSCDLSNGIKNTKLSRIRPSERKTSTLSVEQRKDLFEKTVVPLYGLKQDDKDYKVLERVCVDGIYGSQSDDWKLDTNKVVRVYDQCGWTLPKDQTR